MVPVKERAGTPALEIRDLRKVYGSTVALGGVDIAIRQGEIHGLVGANGAGKSTLVRILAGIEPGDAGEINVAGERLPDRHSPDDARRLGLAFLHQSIGLVPSLSIRDNVCLVAGYARRGWAISPARSRAVTRRALAKVGLDSLDIEMDAGELPLAQQAAVAIARALQLDAKVIVLDEPTAALQQHEVGMLFETLVELTRHGVSAVFVSHRMDEVVAICKRVTMLRNGRCITTIDVTPGIEATLVDLIAGHAPSEVAGAAPRSERAHSRRSVEESSPIPRLVLRGLTTAGAGPIDLHLARGTITGVTGLADGGHLELAGAIAGLSPAAGEMELDGRAYAPRTMSDALGRGVAYVPADRLAAGLAGSLSLRENLFMNPAEAWYQPIRRRHEQRAALQALDACAVHPDDPERGVVTLSGGNQQKVLLAKWLRAEPRLLILCEPTAGVDVGAKAEIYRLLRARASEVGLTAIVASSDFDEVSELCDSVLVLARGRPVCQLIGAEADAETITRAAYGMAPSRGHGGQKSS